jgi:hypothetical protein
MIQCKDCEHFVQGPAGQVGFKCDPFSTIKEPECLVKWQLLRTSEMSQKLDRLVSAYEATLSIYKKFAPMQEKMMRHMEREIEDQDEADSWKVDDEETEEGEPEGPGR